MLFSTSKNTLKRETVHRVHRWRLCNLYFYVFNNIYDLIDRFFSFSWIFSIRIWGDYNYVRNIEYLCIWCSSLNHRIVLLCWIFRKGCTTGIYGTRVDTFSTWVSYENRNFYRSGSGNSWICSTGIGGRCWHVHRRRNSSSPCFLKEKSVYVRPSWFFGTSFTYPVWII